VQSALQLARQHSIQIDFVTTDNLDVMLPQLQHQGIVIVCKPQKQPSLEQWLIEQDNTKKWPTILVLDQVQDPQNLGACLRLAAAFEVDAIIIQNRNAVGVNPTVAKVASGADAIVPVIQVVNITRALKTLKEAGFWIYGTSEQGKENIDQADVAVPVAWVMGNEAKGMRHQVTQSCDKLFLIPTATTFSTLNVAMSSGICLYETLNKRKALKANS
tara:strand:- start:717 stop:1364 length:648 start_codon:yes stop_codon:yes gene_type:complete